MSEQLSLRRNQIFEIKMKALKGVFLRTAPKERFLTLMASRTTRDRTGRDSVDPGVTVFVSLFQKERAITYNLA